MRWDTRDDPIFSPYIQYLLSDLDYSPPEVLGLSAMALMTHLMVNCVLHHKYLLQYGPTQHLTIT